MKKIISIILSVSMILAIAATMGLTIAAAPEGTAVNTAAEFAAMTADGKYYLAADITINATYANEFTGTFDGNGHTVTVTAPMFACTNGATISNFTVYGELGDETTAELDSYLFVAAVAVVANGKSTFKDIVSNVNFTATRDKARYGAIAAYSQAGYDITLENCVNNGSVNANVGGGNYAGGVYGWTAKKGTAVFKNCVNNGPVTSKGYCGGVVCRASGKEGGSATFENCVNTAKLTSEAYAAGIVAYGEAFHTVTGCVNFGEIVGNGGKTGGIVANLGDPKAQGTHVIKGNVNYGTVTNGTAGGGGTAGIAGYIWASPTAYAIVENNINYGTITAPAFCAQIVAYTNSDKTVIKNNVCAGKLVSDSETGTVFVGSSSANAANYAISGNYVVENDGIKMFAYAAADSNAANRIALADRPEGSIIFVSEAQLVSDDVISALNTAAGATVFEVRNGKIALVCDHNYPTVDVDDAKAPTCGEAGHEAGKACSICGHIVSDGAEIPATGNHEYENGVCKNCGAIESADSAPETTEPGQSGDTGDSAWIYLVFAAVAVLGTAIVAKKREN